jgi:hypothetical protein
MNTYNVSISDNNGNIVWSQLLDDVELLAGILAAGIKLVSDLSKESNLEYYIFSNVDVFSYRKESYFSSDRIKDYKNDKISEGEYGIWVSSEINDQYHLYKFNLPVFFKGIIFLCESFKIDYKDYIYSMPFDYMNEKYEFIGYYMLNYNGNAAIIPSIPEDEEEEEDKDDENKLYPFDLD